MPPKEETNGFGFYAWQVWYEADGKRSYGYVVFDIDAFVFEWYGPAGRQEEEEVQ